MAGMRWTEAEVAALIELSKAGAMMDDVRKVFPYRAMGSLRNKALDLGLNLRGPEPHFDEAAFTAFMKARKAHGSNRK